MTRKRGGRRNRVLVFVLLVSFYGLLTFYTSNSQNTEVIFQRSEVKVNPYTYTETIPASHICDDKTDLVVLVNSAFKNVDKRNMIRETWAHLVQSGRWIHGEPLNWNIRVGFIFGVHEDPEDNKGMIEEAKEKKDIIMGDFLDTYRNITLKSLMGINWVTKHCKSAKYFLKSDDDVIINFPVILKQLESSKIKTNSIWGPLTLDAPTRRDGKYYLSYSDYPFYYLPPYMRGSAYVMSADTLRPVFETSEYVPVIPVDDVYITGILAKILEINLHEKDATKWGEEEATPCGLISGRYVVGFYPSAQAQWDVWRAMQDTHQSECFNCALLLRIVRWCPKRTSIQL